jgi:hypothetical protein
MSSIYVLNLSFKITYRLFLI